MSDSPTLTPEKIAELEALDAKRTQGEWTAHSDGAASLIKDANALPALLADWRRMRKALEKIAAMGCDSVRAHDMRDIARAALGGSK